MVPLHWPLTWKDMQILTSVIFLVRLGDQLVRLPWILDYLLIFVGIYTDPHTKNRVTDGGFQKDTLTEIHIQYGGLGSLGAKALDSHRWGRGSIPWPGKHLSHENVFLVWESWLNYPLTVWDGFLMPAKSCRFTCGGSTLVSSYWKFR